MVFELTSQLHKAKMDENILLFSEREKLVFKLFQRFYAYLEAFKRINQIFYSKLYKITLLHVYRYFWNTF